MAKDVKTEIREKLDSLDEAHLHELLSWFDE